MVNCYKCEEELLQRHSGEHPLNEDRDIEDSFVALEYECTNEKCEAYKKKQEIFFDFTRVEIEGDAVIERIDGTIVKW